MIKEKLISFYFREMHSPSWVSLFINPFYFARKGLYRSIKAIAPQITGRTLDVGCGSKPYKFLYNSSEYIGLEIDTKENKSLKDADYYYDGNNFPFNDNDFDSIVANEVFEHVFNPDNFLNEINRILKTDGKLFMTIPFVWDEHEQPFDYARYSSYGIKSILEKHGFAIVEQRKSVSDIRVIFQLLNLYTFKKLVSKNGMINLLVTLIFIAPINILGSLINLILPLNSDLYLDNIILARKIKND
jgi:SAM-dependent methyltransferase